VIRVIDEYQESESIAIAILRRRVSVAMNGISGISEDVECFCLLFCMKRGRGGRKATRSAAGTYIVHTYLVGEVAY